MSDIVVQRYTSSTSSASQISPHNYVKMLANRAVCSADRGGRTAGLCVIVGTTESQLRQRVVVEQYSGPVLVPT